MADRESEREDGIDVVAIMTPPGSHQIIAEYFIKKNFHVISDKPFASTYDQAKKLYSTIKKNKKIVVYLSMGTLDQLLEMAKKLVKRDKAGNIIQR